MTRVRRALALSAVCALLVLDGGAGAADPLPAGSWTQLRQRLPTGDTPDLQADQGDDLAVENGPGGVVALSAVQAPPGDGAVQALAMTLREPPTGTPVLWACPVEGTWRPGPRQVWQDRPDHDCARHSVGTVTDSLVTFDLTSLGAATRQVVLVPGEDAGSFVARFAPPAATSFTLAASGESRPTETTAPPVEEAPASAPEEQPADEGVAPAVDVPGLAPGGAAAPVVPDEPVVAPVAPGPPPVVDAATDAALERVTAAEPLLPTSGVSRAGPLLLGFLALLAMVRTAVPVRSGRAPRSLLAHPEEPATAPAAP